MTDAAAPMSGGLGALAALVLFIGASVWLGERAQRVVERGSFMKGYFLGNRALGSWALALTATVQSGGTFMGFPSLVYSFGWVVALWIAGYMIVPLTGFGILGKRVAQLSRRTGAITVPDMFRERFASPATGLVASLLILFFMTFMMVAQFKAGALIMKATLPGAAAPAPATVGPVAETSSSTKLPAASEQRLDGRYRIGLAVFAIAVVGYTLIGGFLAAVWTDLFQSVMMFLGVMALLPLTLLAAGGLPAASEALRYEVKRSAAPKEGSPERAVYDEGIAAARQLERPLQELHTDLRTYADAHSGALPQRLNDLGAASAPTSEMAWFGNGRTLPPQGASPRFLLALTEKPTNGVQAALYSNGTLEIGRFSRPGDLITGPGPENWQPIGMAASMFFVWIFSGLGSPAGMVRIMACRDTATIRRSICLLSYYNLFIYLPLIAICVCGRSLMPDLPADRSDEIIPRLAILTTRDFWGGSFLAGLILAAPFGAVMATVSSYLVVIASGLVRDVYQRFIDPDAGERTIRWLSYGCMILVGFIAIAANIHPPDYLQSIVVFSGTCGATAFVAPALLAAYWRRATAAGALTGMLAGVSVTLSLYSVGWSQGVFRPYMPAGLDPVVWGLLASCVLSVAVSLLTAPPPAEVVGGLFDDIAPAAGPLPRSAGS